MQGMHGITNVFEDAKIHQENIFAVYIDYSKAFNTIDQDKLLQILAGLQFPNVAKDTSKDLCAGAAGDSSGWGQTKRRRFLPGGQDWADAAAGSSGWHAQQLTCGWQSSRMYAAGRSGMHNSLCPGGNVCHAAAAGPVIQG